MDYQVRLVADELLVSPEDLKEVYDSFFPETMDILAECESALQAANANLLRQRFHALKGSTANLRMNNMSALAKSLEIFALAADMDAIARELPSFRQRFELIKEQVETFYKSN